MEKHKTKLMLNLLLAILSFLYLIVMILSLLDIYKGREPDLSEEWGVVIVGIILFAAFTIITIVNMIRLLIKDKQLISPGEAQTNT